MSPKPARLAIAIEGGDKKVFASALEWPGWSRSAKSVEEAVARLLEYVPRYALVARRAKLDFPEAFDAEVAEREGGGSGTDFGVPSSLTLEADGRRVDAKEAERLASIVEAAWATFDRVAAGAPAELRKGPRGGGRDRDRMVGHVMGADSAYARELGIKVRELGFDDREAYEALRAEMLDVLRRPSDGSPIADRKWTQRYAARRIAWHALDHAWEMEDRSEPDGR